MTPEQEKEWGGIVATARRWLEWCGQFPLLSQQTIVVVDTELTALRQQVEALRGERDAAQAEATRLQGDINAACEKVYTPDVDAETADDLAEAIMALWTKQEPMVAALEYYADQTDDMDERMDSWEHLPGPDEARRVLAAIGVVLGSKEEKKGC